MVHAGEPALATLDGLFGMVRRHTGIAMTERKSVLLQGRLAPRLRALALDSYEQYLALLQAGGPEVQVFINMVTTNDTLFFRTPAVWQWLADDFLPRWQREHEGQCLRIWSAAAATGEEAWSLAMLCHRFGEQQGGQGHRFAFRIVGTDISTSALAAAGAGRYAGRTAQQLLASHPDLAARYFSSADQAIMVGADLRPHVQFSPHNLFDGFRTAQQFDLVFLRNVMIYFDEDNQRRVLARVRAAMAPHARLVLGEQESITRLGTALRFEQTHVYGRGEGDD